MHVSSDQVERFHTDGFVVLDRLLPDATLDALDVARERIVRGEYSCDRRPAAFKTTAIQTFGERLSTLWTLNARWVDQTVWDATTSSELGELVAQLLGGGAVSVLEDQLLDKPPGGNAVAFHQDYRYWAFSTSTRMATTWIALNDMSPEIGTLQMVRGSHRWGYMEPKKPLAVDFYYLLNGKNDAYRKAVQQHCPAGHEPEYVNVTVPRGGGVVFHSLTLHGSSPNLTDRNRRALSVHFASDECRMDRSKLAEQTYMFGFEGIESGRRLVNKFIPQSYPALLENLVST